MNPKLSEKIKKEIRRRAFEQSDRLQQEKQNQQDVQYTLDALHEVTGLPRPQLKTIANAAMLSVEVHPVSTVQVPQEEAVRARWREREVSPRQERVPDAPGRGGAPPHRQPVVDGRPVVGEQVGGLVDQEQPWPRRAPPERRLARRGGHGRGPRDVCVGRLSVPLLLFVWPALHDVSQY